MRKIELFIDSPLAQNKTFIASLLLIVSVMDSQELFNDPRVTDPREQLNQIINQIKVKILEARNLITFVEKNRDYKFSY